MKYTFKTGLTVEGTFDEVQKVAKLLGENLVIDPKEVPIGYYLSETRGLIAISDMEDNHIKNALCKRAMIFYEELQKGHIPTSKSVGKIVNKQKIESFLKSFCNLTESQEIISLYSELLTRSKGKN